MKNKTFKRNVAIISLLCVMLIASFVSITVSWFKNTIDSVGPNITTGKIDVSLTEYHFDGTQWNSTLKYSSPENAAEETTKMETLDAFSMDLSGTNGHDDVFYVVRKNAGSIPLDISLGFLVDGYDEAASLLDADFKVIGGFWYKLENVTEEYQEAEAYFTNGANNPINTENKDLYKQLYLINSDVRTARLDTEDVVVFRLTCGYANHENGIVNRYNKSYNLNINFCVAQLGGLDESTGGDIHYVSTEDELRNKLNEYKPNDAIFLESDVTFYGDLIIDRPLKLYVQGHTLNIEGSLTVSYPDRGQFLINTQRGGKIYLKKIGNSGSLIVDIPNAKLELVGSGNAQIGKGDIYVENEFYVSASFTDGLVLSSSYIRNPSDANEALKNMVIADSTKVSVSANTEVGELIADTNVSLISIYNYGHIAAVDFRSVAYGELANRVITDETVHYVSVQSRLENAGVVDMVYLGRDSLPAMTTNGLLMRYNMNAMIDNASGRYHGNTRLINRLGGHIESVKSNAEIYYADNSSAPIKFVIEEDTNIQYVEKVLTDENGAPLTTHEFIIRYTTRYGDDGLPNYNTTLADVLDWYSGTDLESAYKFTIVCYGGNVLTAQDYQTLNRYTSLVKLDLSGTSSQNGTTPTGAFASLNRLEELLLPNDSKLSANAFAGTALEEVTLQSSYAEIEKNAFSDTDGTLLIRYLHLLQSGADYANLIPDKQYIFVPDEISLSTIRAKYATYPHRFFLDAKRYGDYFLRVINDSVCEVAVFVGSNFNYLEESKSLIQDASRYSSFDFNEFAYRENGRIKTLTVRSFDDYAFYEKIQKENTSVTLHFTNAKTIGEYAFYHCTGITGALTFSGNVNIESHAFEKCTEIERILGVDASNAKIGSHAFSDCTTIYEVYIPGFTHVGAYAFCNCTGIYAARMPQLYSLGREAFLQSQNLRFLETALIIDGEGWDGVHGSPLNAIYTATHDPYNIQTFLDYVVNVKGLPSGMEFPESMPNILRPISRPSSCIKIMVPTGYEDFVKHLSSSGGGYIHTQTSKGYMGTAKYLKLDETTGNCVRWDSPYRFEKVGSDNAVEFIYADYLYTEVDGGARLIACLDDQITGDYYLPDVIVDGSKTIYVTEIDTRLFFTTHLGTYQNATSVTCNLTFGEHVRVIEDQVFDTEPNQKRTDDSGLITRKINIVNFGGLQVLGKCILKNGADGNRNANISEVYAPNVTLIKEEALADSTKGLYLDDAHFPLLKTIEKSAFSNTAVTSINLSTLAEIGESAFSGCTGLQSIHASALKTIGDSAFSGCWALGEVWAENLETVGNSAFYTLTALKTVYMPSVVTLGENCFYGCRELTSFSSETLTEMGTGCFYNCAKLASIHMPALTSVPTDGFRGCALVNVSLPSATSFDIRAFHSNNKLKTLNAPQVTYLGQNALYNCTLWWINIPSFVQSTSNSSCFNNFKGAVYGNLGDYSSPAAYISSFLAKNNKVGIITYGMSSTVFTEYDASNVILLRSNGTQIPYDTIWRDWTVGEEEIPFRIYVKGAESNTLMLAFLHDFYPNEITENAYTLQDSLVLNGQTYVVTALTTGVISRFDFKGNPLVLPVTVGSIPIEFATKNTTLTGIVALGVKSIGANAFASCTYLKTANFANATSIWQYAFDGCSSLASLNLNGLQRIEAESRTHGGHFRNCTSLVSMSFPALTYVYDFTNSNPYGIFDGCTNLTAVSIGKDFNQTLSARNMFRNCSSLMTVTFDGCPTISASYSWNIPASANATIYVAYANYDAFIAQNPTFADMTQYYEDTYQDPQTGITYYLKQLSFGEYELTLIEIPAGFASDRVELLSVYNERKIVSLSASAWNGLSNQGIQTLVLPAYLRFFNNKDSVADVENYEISAENAAFSAQNGILYSKDGTILIAYPKCKQGDSFTLPSTVTMISSRAFSGTENLVTLTVNQKVIVCDAAFYECVKLQNVVFTQNDPSLFVGKQIFVACELENSIVVWIPVGATEAYQNAVMEDLNLPSKFMEGTP